MTIMQGDSYNIPFQFAMLDDETGEGIPITDEMVTDVSITLDGITKTMNDGDITYNDGDFLFPMTQEDSFSLSGIVGVQATLTLAGGDIVGAEMEYVAIIPADARANA